MVPMPTWRWDEQGHRRGGRAAAVRRSESARGTSPFDLAPTAQPLGTRGYKVPAVLRPQGDILRLPPGGTLVTILDSPSWYPRILLADIEGKDQYGAPLHEALGLVGGR